MLTHMISAISYPKVDGDSLFHHEYREKRKKGSSRRIDRFFSKFCYSLHHAVVGGLIFPVLENAGALQQSRAWQELCGLPVSGTQLACSESSPSCCSPIVSEQLCAREVSSFLLRSVGEEKHEKTWLCFELPNSSPQGTMSGQTVQSVPRGLWLMWTKLKRSRVTALKCLPQTYLRQPRPLSPRTTAGWGLLCPRALSTAAAAGPAGPASPSQPAVPSSGPCCLSSG